MKEISGFMIKDWDKRVKGISFKEYNNKIIMSTLVVIASHAGLKIRSHVANFCHLVPIKFMRKMPKS